MRTYYHEVCRTAMVMAGPRNVNWNIRYREALAELGLRLGSKPANKWPGYPDGVPIRAPQPVPEGDEGWDDQYLLWNRRGTDA